MYEILLYDGVEPIDVGAAFGALSMARRIAGETAPLDQLAERHETDTAAIVDSGDVVTGGVTLGLDLMFHCLARSHGAAVAAEVARVMEYSRALAANRAALGYR
ncbi:MAG: hypothetical protein RLO51_22315 [Thalassobaculum sp.]|uniref:hypothetical protein n=1 Tax=Thalassobaculum sp. TaxID=2022740 RepID=UPI0032EE3EDD